MATTTDYLHALQDAAATLEESPTKQQYEDLGLTPAASTILRHFDGWNAAKREVGLDTNTSTGSRVGPMPDDVDFTDAELAALSQDQRWHYRNREHNTQRTLDRRDRLRPQCTSTNAITAPVNGVGRATRRVWSFITATPTRRSGPSAR